MVATDNPLLNLTIGYVTFAQEERHLFRFLFFEHPQQLSARRIRDLEKLLPEDVRKHQLDYMFTKINARELDAVMLNSWIFTHGLATLVHSRVLSEIRSRDIINLLNQAGATFAGRKEHRARAITKRKQGNT